MIPDAYPGEVRPLLPWPWVCHFLRHYAVMRVCPKDGGNLAVCKRCGRNLGCLQEVAQVVTALWQRSLANTSFGKHHL